MEIKIPYYKTHLVLKEKKENIAGILKPKPNYKSSKSEHDIVKNALANTYGGTSLGELSKGAINVLIITSDHTRPVPSKLTMPFLLEEIRAFSPKANIKILIATGFHRPSAKDEIINKFGKQIANNEQIVNHDCRDTKNMVYKGRLPSGGELWLNSLVDWAELIIAEGFIEPHFFAGFSGGRKSILPGIAAEKTVLANHCSEFIASDKARAGNLCENPIHRDMVFAAQAAGLRFILNVTLDENKKITAAFAGEPYETHKKGCEFISESSKVAAIKSDIVITSNGGYPMDQNIYQAVKGMTAAESCVNENGVIIMVASCCDGHGGYDFYKWFRNTSTPDEILSKIAKIKRDETLPDQWEAQVLARILKRNRVIIVTNMCDATIIEEMHMHHAAGLDSALRLARRMTCSNSKFVVIPDGVGIIVE